MNAGECTVLTLIHARFMLLAMVWVAEVAASSNQLAPVEQDYCRQSYSQIVHEGLTSPRSRFA